MSYKIVHESVSSDLAVWDIVKSIEQQKIQGISDDASMITGLKHVGIAVKDIDETVKLFEKTLGLKHEKTVTLDERKLKIAFLDSSEVRIELLEPMDKEGTIAKFLENRGEGLHHIAFKVTDIEKTLAELKQQGVKLIDETPRKGAEGGKIAFIHPKSMKGVLIELCEG